MGRFVLGLSGGSGVAYGLRLLEVLLQAGHEVHSIISTGGLRVLRHEVGLVGVDLVSALPEGLVEAAPGCLVQHHRDAVEALPASGSVGFDGVVICPCSMGTLARVAHGFSSNLLERAADVALKEARGLILVPRETPLSVVHLRNMLALAEAGAVVLPAMPGFYQRPARVEDLVDFVVARVLDQLGIDHALVARWATPAGSDGSQYGEGEDSHDG